MNTPCLTMIAIGLASLNTACIGGRTVFAYSAATGGNAQRGKNLIMHYDCGSCHSIPGIREARGVVGPPMILMGRQTYIAGQAPNTPENLVKWIQDPKSIEPGTAMPKLGITEAEARDIAAYIYTLRSRDWNGGGE